jgi:hypothetical protein
MFGYKTNGSNTYIPPEEAAKMRDYFSGYPHAYTGGGQGTSQKGH